jgi:hypothetical protein
LFDISTYLGIAVMFGREAAIFLWFWCMLHENKGPSCATHHNPRLGFLGPSRISMPRSSGAESPNVLSGTDVKSRWVLKKKTSLKIRVNVRYGI